MATPLASRRSADAVGVGLTNRAASVWGEADKPRPTRSARAWTSRRRAVIGWATLLGFLYLAFVLLPAGRQLDQVSLPHRLQTGAMLRESSNLLLGLITPASAGAAWLAILAWPAVRDRHLSRVGIRPAAAVLGAILSAELLKRLLPQSIEHGWSLGFSGAGSFPSGHATLAVAFATAWPAVLGDVWRARVSGPMAVWAAATVVATVPAGWHRPSEAVAGAVLAALWRRVMRLPTSTRSGPTRAWLLVGLASVAALLWTAEERTWAPADLVHTLMVTWVLMIVVVVLIAEGTATRTLQDVCAETR